MNVAYNNQIFIFDESTTSLTVYDLDDNSESSFPIEGQPGLVVTSTDGRFLLVGTKTDDLTPAEEMSYYLIDLRKQEIVEVEMNVGKNLFLVRNNV
jgi:hypothetical protein